MVRNRQIELNTHTVRVCVCVTRIDTVQHTKIVSVVLTKLSKNPLRFL